jgi:hypothetical protein
MTLEREEKSMETSCTLILVTKNGRWILMCFVSILVLLKV